MSSTNRGYNRHKSDYYITPVDDILNFIDEFVAIEDDIEGNILDCCAGGDKKHLMSYPTALNTRGYNNIATLDIRDDSLAEIKKDYLTWTPNKDYNVIMTNPPFNLAEKIIEKALNDVSENGFVIMLLRLNFFGSKKRFDMWNKQLPKYCFVHHKRMSFTDNSGTDSIEYCHMVWQKGYYPKFTKLKVI